jgi:hypothetical protein
MTPSRPSGASKRRAPSRGGPSTPTSAAEKVDINYERLRALTRVIQLNSISLISGGIVSHVDPRTAMAAAGEQREYTLALVDARWWLDSTSLDVVLGYRVTASATRDGNRASLFTVDARFAVGYGLPAGATALPQDQSLRESLLADMVSANGQINTFPYLRQFVSDLTTRAGWSPLVLNVFRAPARRPRALVRMARAWA